MSWNEAHSVMNPTASVSLLIADLANLRQSIPQTHQSQLGRRKRVEDGSPEEEDQCRKRFSSSWVLHYLHRSLGHF